MSKRWLSGRDRLASIASPQSGQRFGVSGALMLDGMTGPAALDVNRRWSALVVLPIGRMTGVAAAPRLHQTNSLS